MRISHIGIAVKDLAASEKLFAKLLGEDHIHHEEVADQKVRIASFQLGDSLIELTEPSDPNSSVAKFIEKRGEGVHHIALEVDDVNKELSRLKGEGFQLIDERSRLGSHGMQIAFLHPKSTNGVLIELCSHAPSAMSPLLEKEGE
ncbi:MAG TPA: methylmalonyl-CoA epimerase [Candidatus Kapabacteria bacterium]|nr:methylmalonyl-CoA epimerase [Candidatus Kapabacteria bacterium]